MIIYGSKAVHLKSAQSTALACPKCGTTGSLVFSVFRRHAHIFWIPLFPIGKVTVCQCQHCQAVMKSGEMIGDVRKQARLFANSAKGPIWQFAGLAIIAILIVKGMITSQITAKEEKAYLEVPVKGDVYQYKISSSEYSTMKVMGVTKDSVFLLANDYSVNKSSGFYKISKEENYTNSFFALSKGDLEEMYTDGKIIGVIRKSD